MEEITYEDFKKIEMRVGKIIEVNDFPKARKPAFKLRIDFGPEIGVKKSSAQITELYSKEDLLNRIVVCVINFPNKQIGPFMSECLTMGAETPDGPIALMGFDNLDVQLGAKVY